MDLWIEFNQEKPPVGIEVLAMSELWIDEDFNKHGVRIGFLNEDENGSFISSKWNNYQDVYTTAESHQSDIKRWMPIPKTFVTSTQLEQEAIIKELKKCQESPAYYYNNFVRKDGEPLITDEQIDFMRKSADNPFKHRQLYKDQLSLLPTFPEIILEVPESVKIYLKERELELKDEMFGIPSSSEPAPIKVGDILYYTPGKKASMTDFKEAIVERVGREYLYAKAVSSPYENKIPIKTLECDMRDGTGYRKFFRTKQELIDHNEHTILSSKIVSNVSYHSIQKLSLKQLRDAAKALNVK